MSRLTLKILSETFAIHSLDADSQIPPSVFQAPVYFIGKTLDEVSIVVPDDVEINSDDVEGDWRCFEVVGPLDFTLTGILANISTVLANADISIFAISTFDTDHILVKRDKVEAATAALIAHQYQVIQ